jgi:hypothetical protein
MYVRSFYIFSSLNLSKIKFIVVAYFNQVTSYEYVVNSPFKRPFSSKKIGAQKTCNPENTLESFLCHVHFGRFLLLYSLANER